MTKDLTMNDCSVIFFYLADVASADAGVHFYLINEAKILLRGGFAWFLIHRENCTGWCMQLSKTLWVFVKLAIETAAGTENADIASVPY